MKKSLIISLSIVVLLIGGYFVVQKNTSKTPKTIEKLTVAWVPNQPPLGLMYIAQNKGYFKEEQLDITYKKFPRGIDALT